MIDRPVPSSAVLCLPNPLLNPKPQACQLAATPRRPGLAALHLEGLFGRLGLLGLEGLLGRFGLAGLAGRDGLSLEDEEELAEMTSEDESEEEELSEEVSSDETTLEVELLTLPRQRSPRSELG